MDKNDDYKSTASLYKREEKKINENYSLLEYAKSYISNPSDGEALEHFKEEVQKGSSLALAGVINYIKGLYEKEKGNDACVLISNLIVDQLESKESKNVKM